MNNIEFWTLIDESKSTNADDEKPFDTQYENLLQKLNQLSHPEIMKFYYIFQIKYNQVAADYLYKRKGECHP